MTYRLRANTKEASTHRTSNLHVLKIAVVSSVEAGIESLRGAADGGFNTIGVESSEGEASEDESEDGSIASRDEGRTQEDPCHDGKDDFEVDLHLERTWFQ